MRVLCVGDVCGSIGCNFFAKTVPSFKKENNIDVLIVNGENSADGNGITKESAGFLFTYGADVITGGNHTLRRKEIFPVLETNPYILCPSNIKENPGYKYAVLDKGRYRLAVINLSGKVYADSENKENPFIYAEKLINRLHSEGIKLIILDFHAEATSEKVALGIYLDGKVSALFGTHTHIQTADAKVLENGTGYITDIGMTGPANSVLGVRSDIIIDRLKGSNTTQKFVLADGKCVLSGCIFDIDEKSGKTLSVTPVFIKE